MNREAGERLTVNREMQIIREVNIAAEDCYVDAVRLGDHAAEALTGKHRSQMTGLETLAESALKTSDIFDYIKKQTARSSHWRKASSAQAHQAAGFGERLKTYLEQDLARRVDEICGPDRLATGLTSYEEKQERRHISLLLMRQFIRSLVVEYEYQTSKSGRERES